MRHWFCAMTKPHQEARAAVELIKQDFRAYLPVLHSKPMFPRYLFVEFDRDVDNWGLIRSTRGCCDLLKTGFLPAIVPQHAMDAIMAYKPEPEIISPRFTDGQPVRITHGPFAGHEGLFQQEAKGRVSVLLKLLGGKRKVLIPVNDIEGAA